MFKSALRCVGIALFTLGSVASIVALEPVIPQDALEEQAEELVAQMAGTLKPALQRAMAEGGPAHAIEVCAVKAPEIAAGLSTDGWQVKRVSLKHRNAAAAPDPWERAVLQDFEKRLERGEDPRQLTAGEQTAEGYRFARAQMTEPLCLSCHGAGLAPAVSAKLDALYPEDLATGHRKGDIRGMFSLIYNPAD